MGDYKSYKMIREGMHVTLEMPGRTGEDETEKREIRKALSLILREEVQRYFLERSCR